MEQVRRHVGLLFFINGLLLASWAVEIPSVQARWHLGDGPLGLLLFAMVVGNVAALPLVNGALRRAGVRTTATLSLLGMALSLAVLPFMPGVWLTGLMLGLFGAGFSGVDLAMNTAGAGLEQRLGRPLMSGLHGAFSVGALLGALLGSALLEQGIAPTTHLAALGLLAALAAGWAVAPLPRFPEEAGTGAGQGWVRRLPPAVAGLMVLGFCAALCEGAVNDWSAVLLRNGSGASAGQAGLGFALFSLLMVVGRAFGDRLTLGLGPARLGAFGAGLMILGFLVVLLHRLPWTGILGFGLSGLGLSVLAPLAFSAAGRSAHPSAIASLSATFYGGYLVGPPALGLLSQLTSLHAAFLLPLVLGVVFAALALGTGLLREAPTPGAG